MNILSVIPVYSMYRHTLRILLGFGLLGSAALRADYGSPFPGSEAKAKSWGILFVKDSEVLGFAVYQSKQTSVRLDLPPKESISSACIGYGPIEMVRDKKSKTSGVEILLKEAYTAIDVLQSWSYEPNYNARFSKVSLDGSLEALNHPVTKLQNHFCSFGLWLTLKTGKHVYVDGHIGNRYVVLRTDPEDINSVTVENSVYSDYLEFLDGKYNSKQPNKSLQSTPTAVMSPAGQAPRQEWACLN